MHGLQQQFGTSSLLSAAQFKHGPSSLCCCYVASAVVPCLVVRATLCLVFVRWGAMQHDLTLHFHMTTLETNCTLHSTLGSLMPRNTPRLVFIVVVLSNWPRSMGHATHLQELFLLANAATGAATLLHPPPCAAGNLRLHIHGSLVRNHDEPLSWVIHASLY